MSIDNYIQAYIRLLQPEYFPQYCEMFMRIQSKDRGLIPLVLNPAQMRMHNAMLQLRRAGKPVRLLLLKARQQGFSTYSEAYAFQQTSHLQDYRSAIIAHEEVASRRLYGMFKTYLEHFPDELSPYRKNTGNARMMIFEKLRSSIEVLTAKNALSSSGATYQLVHVSELSKWEQAEQAMLSLMQTIPRQATIIVESTAFGVGNYFYEMWYRAKRGETSFLPLFFAWHEHPEYQIPLEPKELLIADKNEEYYEKRFNLTQEQLKWMRWALKENCGGDWDLFRQEYPAYEQEAFISSGSPVFDVRALQNKELAMKKEPPPVIRGEITLIEEGGKASASFIEDDRLTDRGFLDIYKAPQQKGDTDGTWGYRYVISADVCEGIDRGGGTDKKRKGDTDFNAVCVWDKFKDEQVAFMRNRSDPDELARQLFALVIYYGGDEVPKEQFPLTIIERNKDGLTTILYLRDLMKKYKIPLMRLYHRGDMGAEDEIETLQLGFRTTSDSKPPLIGSMKERIRKGTDGIKSKIIISESLTYVKDARGKMNAQEGQWDDGVIAQALIYEGIRLDPAPQRLKKGVVVTGWRAKYLSPQPVTVGYYSSQSKKRGNENGEEEYYTAYNR